MEKFFPRSLLFLFAIVAADFAQAVPADYPRVPRFHLPGLKESELTEAIKLNLRYHGFEKISELADRFKLKVWLAGGTAATLANHIRWNILSGDSDLLSRARTSLMNHSLANNAVIDLIFHRNQDLDFVVDVEPGRHLTKEELHLFREELKAMFPGRKIEVTSLRQPLHDERTPLMLDLDFSRQHSDTLSTSLIQLASHKDHPLEILNLREMSGIKGSLISDIAKGKAHLLWSNQHRNTRRYMEGMNPEIFEVIRFLIKVSQFDSMISKEDYEILRKVIADWQWSPADHYYIRLWISREAPKILRNAADIERAYDLVENLGLRQKLVEYFLSPFGAKTANNHFLSSSAVEILFGERFRAQPELKQSFFSGRLFERVPLRWETEASDLQQNTKLAGETAFDLGLTVVAHETDDSVAEDISRGVYRSPNFFISRKDVVGELAAHGNGTYFLAGTKGDAMNQVHLNSRHLVYWVDPNARRGIDFEVFAGRNAQGASTEIYVFFNRKSLRERDEFPYVDIRLIQLHHQPEHMDRYEDSIHARIMFGRLFSRAQRKGDFVTALKELTYQWARLKDSEKGLRALKTFRHLIRWLNLGENREADWFDRQLKRDLRGMLYALQDEGHIGGELSETPPKPGSSHYNQIRARYMKPQKEFADWFRSLRVAVAQVVIEGAENRSPFQSALDKNLPSIVEDIKSFGAPEFEEVLRDEWRKAGSQCESKLRALFPSHSAPASLTSEPPSF